MIPQYTAASIVSQNKQLCTPASVDTIDSSNGQEDHVSMATFAARRLHAMLDNVRHIVAIELLAAAQGIEFHHPERSSPALENVVAALREVSPRYTDDRSLSGDIVAVAALIERGIFLSHAASVLPAQSD